MSFTDGHAKSVAFKAGIWPGVGAMGLPKSQADQTKWCRDPDLVGAGMGCRDWAHDIETNTQWFAD